MSLPGVEIAPWTIAALLGTVLLAYTLFGATGFGAGIVSIPLLAHALPLPLLVPLVALLDLTAGAATGLRRYAEVERREVWRLLPFMILGMALGVSLLLSLSTGILLLCLGVFIVANALWQLFGRSPTSVLAPAWAAPLGVAGGTFAAWFGTGGPIYVIFLAGRLSDPRALRSTIAFTILISAILRLAIFGASGLLLRMDVLALYALALPAMALGLWLGGRLHDRLPRARALQVISLALLGNGVLLVVRGAAMA